MASWQAIILADKAINPLQRQRPHGDLDVSGVHRAAPWWRTYRVFSPPHPQVIVILGLDPRIRLCFVDQSGSDSVGILHTQDRTQVGVRTLTQYAYDPADQLLTATQGATVSFAAYLLHSPQRVRCKSWAVRRSIHHRM